MKVVYALEELPEVINKSLFIAGPTPRNEDGNPWRQEALKLLEEKGYDGVVFIPEPRSGEWQRNYDAQVEWEDLCLNVADCIVFWVPRDLKTMPAMTTNIEWGRWETSGKCVLGFPPEAEKMRYMEHYAKQEKIPTASTLSETLDLGISFVEKEAPRSGGDRYIPLYIWNTPQFQSWYEAQTAVGNYLNSAKVLFTYHHVKRQFGLFLFIVRANVYVAAESRIKAFDFLLSRSDVSSVLLWRRNEEDIKLSDVILVSEFRPSVSNKNCYIVELPSGSTPDPKENDPLNVAVEEVWEETGFAIEPDRLKLHMARQLIAPLSSHKSYFYSAEITEEELDWFKSQKDLVHGNVNSGERTFIQVRKIKDLFENDDLDWSTLGQILSVLYYQ